MRTTHGGRRGAPLSLEPASVLVHPEQVLHHPTMTDDEKRALLSSWASDRRAIEDAPTLRRLDSGAIVPVADVLAALAAIPAKEGQAVANKGWAAASRRQRPALVPWRRVRTAGPDHDPPTGGRAAIRLVPLSSVNA